MRSIAVATWAVSSSISSSREADASVITERLWSRSECTSRTWRLPASADITSRSCPSEKLGTAWNRAALAWSVLGKGRSPQADRGLHQVDAEPVRDLQVALCVHQQQVAALAQPQRPALPLHAHLPPP